MAGDGSTRTSTTTQQDISNQPVTVAPPGRIRRFGRTLKRNRLGLAALLPAFAMAAVFVAEPFAGVQTVDQPTGPATSAPAPYTVPDR